MCFSADKCIKLINNKKKKKYQRASWLTYWQVRGAWGTLLSLSTLMGEKKQLMNNSMYWALCSSTLKCHRDIHLLQKTKALQNNQQKLGNYVSAWNEERRGSGIGISFSCSLVGEQVISGSQWTFLSCYNKNGKGRGLQCPSILCAVAFIFL